MAVLRARGCAGVGGLPNDLFVYFGRTGTERMDRDHASVRKCILIAFRLMRVFIAIRVVERSIPWGREQLCLEFSCRRTPYCSSEDSLWGVWSYIIPYTSLGFCRRDFDRARWVPHGVGAHAAWWREIC